MPAVRVVFRVIRIGEFFRFGPLIIRGRATSAAGRFLPCGSTGRAGGCTGRAGGNGSGSGRRGGGISFWAGTTTIGAARARLSCR